MRTRKDSPRSIKKQQCFLHFTEDPRHKINTVPTPPPAPPGAFLRQLGNGWSGAGPELSSDFLTHFPFLFSNQGIQFEALRESSSSLNLSVSIDEVTSEGPSSSSLT